MQVGIVGLGRMGSNIARRLMRGGHQCVVFDARPQAVSDLAKDGAKGVGGIEDLMGALQPPRIVWIMLPAGDITERVVEQAGQHAVAGDIVIDAGNSFYRDDMRRAEALLAKGVHYVDVGTSGGVWGFERGYCLMIGGEKDVVAHLDPIFATLAPSVDSVPRTPGRDRRAGTAEHGYLHCGPSGAGHFVKVIHNGIEYGVMAAYAEGFNILRHADAGLNAKAADAETAPLQEPNAYRFSFDVAEIAEVWRRGSVIGSWLLDLTAAALAQDPQLSQFEGRVSDSGEGRWTVKAAIDEGVPAPVLSAALYERFQSQGQANFAERILSAMRHEFGGHVEKKAG